MSSINKILIVGGGIAGMCAAIALRRAGVSQVDLIERYDRNSALGIGIILPGNALRALHQLRVLGTCLANGEAIHGQRMHDADGNRPQDLIGGTGTAGPEFPSNMGITRPIYNAILTAAAEQLGANIRYGMKVEALQQDDDGVDIVLNNGEEQRYQLVVGADGIHSSIRRLVFGELGSPVYTGQSAWRYAMPRPPEVDKIMMYAAENCKAGLVPLRPDLMYLFLTDSETHSEPAKDQILDYFLDRLSPFGGYLADLKEQYINDPDEVMWKPFDAVDLPPPWYKGRVLIIGDGAHATTAHLGQGGAMAVEDAVVLGEEVGRGGDHQAALSAFMERRWDRVNFIQRACAQLCQWEQERRTDADYIPLMEQANKLVSEPL